LQFFSTKISQSFLKKIPQKLPKQGLVVGFLEKQIILTMRSFPSKTACAPSRLEGDNRLTGNPIESNHFLSLDTKKID
jgi:hypothetical protein